MKRRSVISILIVFLAAFSIFLFFYYPLISAHLLNYSLHTSNVKLLMMQEEVEKVLGDKGVFEGGFGCRSYKYEKAKLTVYYSIDGLLQGKVSTIFLADPSYDVLGIHPGDTYNHAADMLSKKGFKRYTDDKDRFYKNGIELYLYGSEIRITVTDRTTAGRVY